MLDLLYMTKQIQPLLRAALTAIERTFGNCNVKFSEEERIGISLLSHATGIKRKKLIRGYLTREDFKKIEKECQRLLLFSQNETASQ